MNIRTKIAVWYSAFFLVLMIMLVTIVFFTIHYFMYSNAEHIIQTNAAKLLSVIEIEEDNEIIKYPAVSGCNFTVFSLSDEIIYDNTGWEKPDNEPIEWDTIKKVTVDGEGFLLLDTQIIDENVPIGRLRVISATGQIERVINITCILFALIIPVFMAIVVTVSLFIASKALSPIDQVTNTARQIGKLDLSKRIEAHSTDDEVGRLIKTFNGMLENLESAFVRERQFSSDASHELRTPLSVISTHAEEALYGQKTVLEYREALGQIKYESQRMNKIINQLLMLARGYENRLSINKESFSLKAVICDVANEMKDMADDFGVTIHYRQQQNIVICADHMLITQMLINLFSNACKYGKVGGTAIVSTEVMGGDITIIVEDNGIGISEDDLSHVFERFYRADKSHSGNGSGLGLPIVKWIVEVHSGNIEIASGLGKGTCVKIKIPYEI